MRRYSIGFCSVVQYGRISIGLIGAPLKALKPPLPLLEGLLLERRLLLTHDLMHCHLEGLERCLEIPRREDGIRVVGWQATEVKHDKACLKDRSQLGCC